MSTEVYLGLTTLEAGVFAIFAASVFVLMQTAAELFTPGTSYDLTKNWLARVGVGFSFGLLVFGMIATVKSAFPSADLIPGNQQSAVLIEGVWPVAIFALFVAASIALNLIVLLRLLGDLRGPGMVLQLAGQVRTRSIVDWLDWVAPPPLMTPYAALASIRRSSPVSPFGENDDYLPERSVDENDEAESPTRLTLTHNEPVDRDQASADEEPPSEEQATEGKETLAGYIDNQNLLRGIRQERLSSLHAHGRLTDPFGPLFEVAARSIESRRYSLVDRSLAAIRELVDDVLGNADEFRPEGGRLLQVLLLPHLRDTLEVALHSGSHSQLEVLIRTCEGIAIDAGERERASDIPKAICDELVDWAKQLNERRFRHLRSPIIESMYLITSSALLKKDINSFHDGILRIAQVGEIIGREYEPEVGTHILERNIGRDRWSDPSSTLQNNIYSLVREFISSHAENPKDSVYVQDALYVCCRSFIEAPQFDKRAAEIAREFLSGFKELAEAAIEKEDGNVVWLAIHNLMLITDLENFESSPELQHSLAWDAFELGMLVEARGNTFRYTGSLSNPDDLVQRIARLCARCSQEAMQDAITSLYDRGHTMHIPDAPQARFLQRVEKTFGHTFARY